MIGSQHRNAFSQNKVFFESGTLSFRPRKCRACKLHPSYLCNRQVSQMVPESVKKDDASLVSRRLLLPLTLLTTCIVSKPELANASDGNRQVYLDVKIDGEAAGKIVIELFPECPIGSQRFEDLVEEKQGVGYRLSKFNGIFDTYIRNDGVKSLSYLANATSLIAGGDSLDALETELASQTRAHDNAGMVSLVVKESKERPVRERLVAMNGKLVTVKDQAGEAPNGTAFAITTAASPELDATNLIIGRVVEGMELVQAISVLPINKPRDNNPYFALGKAMGDKRAITAEKGFNRPFLKVVVSGGGVA